MTGSSDQWSAAGDEWRVTSDEWRLTTDDWRLTIDDCQLPIANCLLTIVYCLLTIDYWLVTSDRLSVTGGQQSLRSPPRPPSTLQIDSFVPPFITGRRLPSVSLLHRSLTDFFRQIQEDNRARSEAGPSAPVRWGGGGGGCTHCMRDGGRQRVTGAAASRSINILRPHRR